MTTTPTLRDAAQALIAAVQEQHDTHEGVLKHAVPYGAVVALKEAITRHDAALTEPVGWITMWPAMGGGRRHVYTDGAAKPSYGPELDSRLSITPVYTALAAPVDALAERTVIVQLDQRHHDVLMQYATLRDVTPANLLKMALRLYQAYDGEAPKLDKSDFLPPDMRRTEAQAAMQPDVVAWGIWDSQGFYDWRNQERAAKAFCVRYNQRPNDPLKPYTYAPIYAAPPATQLQQAVGRARKDEQEIMHGLLRPVVVEAIRGMRGAPDIEENGKSLVTEIEEVFRAAIRAKGQQ